MSWKESSDSVDEDLADGMMKLSMVVEVIPGLDVEYESSQICGSRLCLSAVFQVH